LLGLFAAYCQNPALRDPKNALWSKPAPEVYRVRIDTGKGSFVLEITRALAPRGSDRFYHLVETGFYDDSRFFRVIAGRFAQFGIPAIRPSPASGEISRFPMIRCARAIPVEPSPMP
jgi:Cyclophilin type peptidyl-prolyl cis-trans isomerase/CLD